MENLTELKANFLADVKAIVQMEEVSACFVINWDHTAITYVPVGCWTMAKEGLKRFHWQVQKTNDKLQLCLVPQRFSAATADV